MSAIAAPAIGRDLPHGATDAAIRTEQIRLLHGTPFVWLINLINGPVAGWLLWSIYPHWVVFTWLGLLYAVVAARLLLWWRFQHSNVTVERAGGWGTAFTLGTFATGLVWGLLASAIFVTNNSAYHVFVAFVLGGMTAGAAMRDSAYPKAFYAFTAPAILPVFVALIMRSGFMFDAMAALLAAFTGVLLMMGRANSRRIADNIRLRIEQSVLIDNLERMGAELQRHVGDREQAAAELKDAQRLAHIGSWVRQAEPDTLKWSEELYRILGIAPGPEAPRIDDLLHFVEGKSLEHLRGALVACLRDGKPFTIDLQARRADGAIIWISVKGEAARDDKGAITALRGTVQDITERKTAEQNIATLHQQMTEHVEALKRHDQEMRAIARMSDLLQTCHSRGEAFPIVATTARALFPLANGALSLVSSGTREMETVTQWGENSTMLDRFAFDDCWALRTGRRYELPALERGAPCRHFRTPPAGPSVCLPLTVQGETGGLLHMDCPPGTALDEDKQSLMTSFADVVKLSLSNLRMREILGEQAIRDQLTTLFNRHYLVETLPREILRARRDKVPLSVAVLDIDYFKRLNDTYGHDAGDLALKKLGFLLRDAMRGGDVACRYGGEEFLLVLPECDLDDARALVQQICEDAKRLQLVLRETALPRITISAGVAEMGSELSSAEALISAADHALYVAKENGRDRVEVFRAPAPQAARVAL